MKFMIHTLTLIFSLAIQSTTSFYHSFSSNLKASYYLYADSSHLAYIEKEDYIKLNSNLFEMSNETVVIRSILDILKDISSLDQIPQHKDRNAFTKTYIENIRDLDCTCSSSCLITQAVYMLHDIYFDRQNEIQTQEYSDFKLATILCLLIFRLSSVGPNLLVSNSKMSKSEIFTSNEYHQLQSAITELLKYHISQNENALRDWSNLVGIAGLISRHIFTLVLLF